jgi:hypothetical protein
MFTRASDGSLILFGRHPKASPTWHWSVSITKRNGSRWIGRMPREFRRGQWHTFIWLPFGKSLCISRQDYHKQRRSFA